LKKLLLVLSIIVLFASQLSGCGAQLQQTTSDEKQLLRFTLISPLLGHPYWNVVEEGLEDANKEFGVDTEFVGPTIIDYEEQKKYIEAAIAAKVDGIITSALNPDFFQPVIDKAVDAGIPVVLIDNDAPKSKRSVYVGTINTVGGFEAGKAMIEMTDGKAVIGILMGTADATNMIERVAGFRDAIKDYPKMKIVAVEPTNSDPLIANEKLQKMLKEHPEINALFGASGTDILDITRICEEKGLSNKVEIVSYDDVDETIDLIKKGIVYATVAQNPYKMGYLGVKLLKEIKEGKIADSQIIDTGVTVITQENVYDYLDTRSK
jgi:ribose transport system substrate-binding protein